MKFDYAIIGGGLSGLSAAISLAKTGKKTVVISSGQSALHFCGGNFGLINNNISGQHNNFESAISSLPPHHPYSLIGANKVVEYASEVKKLFGEADIKLEGDSVSNHISLSPFGIAKESWLSFPGYVNTNELKSLKKVLILNISGFLEFYPSFIELNLKKQGIECRIETIDFDVVRNMRKVGHDMRTISVAKQITKNAIAQIASAINSITKKDETILIPAILNYNNPNELDSLSKMINNPVYMVPTLPVSVCGVRCQNALQSYFEQLGGTLLSGDKAIKGIIENNRVVGIQTENLEDDIIVADKYILAGGSLFGEGIVATPTKFKETVFGLETTSPEDRNEWTNEDFFASQPYMSYGIEVDNNFNPQYQGKALSNLYVTGSALANCNSLKEGSGAGVAIITALHVAQLANKSI